MKSENDETRVVGVQSVIKVSSKLTTEEVDRVLAVLDGLADSITGHARLIVAGARFVLGKNEALDVLANAAVGQETAERFQALALLQGFSQQYDAMRHKALSASLLQLLTDRDSTIRSSAAWIAGAVPDGRLLPTIIMRVSDPIENVRVAATYSLGRVASRQHH